MLDVAVAALAISYCLLGLFLLYEIAQICKEEL